MYIINVNFYRPSDGFTTLVSKVKFSYYMRTVYLSRRIFLLGEDVCCIE